MSNWAKEALARSVERNDRYTVRATPKKEQDAPYVTSQNTPRWQPKASNVGDLNMAITGEGLDVQSNAHLDSAVRGFKSGLAQSGSGIIGMSQAVNTLMPNEGMGVVDPMRLDVPLMFGGFTKVAEAEQAKETKKWLDNVAKQNKRSRDWKWQDIFADPIDYATSESGLVYDLGNQGGFMAATAPVGGLTGGIVKGTLGLMGRNLGTKGTAALMGAASGLPEAGIEGGAIYNELVAQGVPPEQAAVLAVEVAAKNIPVSVVSNMIQAGRLGKIVDAWGNPTSGSRIANAAKAGMASGLIGGTSGAAEEFVQEGISGQAKGENVWDIYSPSTWGNRPSDEQLTAALIGGISGGAMTGVPGTIGGLFRKPSTGQAEDIQTPADDTQAVSDTEEAPAANQSAAEQQPIQPDNDLTSFARNMALDGANPVEVSDVFTDMFEKRNVDGKLKNPEQAAKFVQENYADAFEAYKQARQQETASPKVQPKQNTPQKESLLEKTIDEMHSTPVQYRNLQQTDNTIPLDDAEVTPSQVISAQQEDVKTQDVAKKPVEEKQTQDVVSQQSKQEANVPPAAPGPIAGMVSKARQGDRPRVGLQSRNGVLTRTKPASEVPSLVNMARKALKGDPNALELFNKLHPNAQAALKRAVLGRTQGVKANAENQITGQTQGGQNVRAEDQNEYTELRPNQQAQEVKERTAEESSAVEPQMAVSKKEKTTARKATFKDTLGEYVTDDYQEQSDTVHNYIKDDAEHDGESIYRSITDNGDGTFTVETETSYNGKKTRGKFDSLEDAERYVETGKRSGENKKPSVELADGYRTESGRPLEEADEKEFIVKPDGSVDFGRFDKSIESATAGKIKSFPIRLQVGNDNFGYIHLTKKHLSQFKQKGFETSFDFINHIINNFTQIYDQSSDLKPNRYVLYVQDKSKGFMPLDLELQRGKDGFYSIVSAMPHGAKIKGTLLYDASATATAATTNGSLLANNIQNGGDVFANANANKESVPSVDFTISQKGKNVKKESQTQVTFSDNAEETFASALGLKKKEQAIKVVDDSDAALEAALKDLQDELNKISANPVFNPDLHKAAFKVGMIYMQRGANRFADWSEQMIGAIGEKIRPWLGSVWKSIVVYPKDKKLDSDLMSKAVDFAGKKYTEGFTSAEEIYQYMVDQYGEENVREFKHLIESAFAGINELYNPTMTTETAQNEPTSTETDAVKETVTQDENEPVSEVESVKTNTYDPTFTLREELNGIEITFGEKPPREFLDKMKDAGYRWNMKGKKWYAKQNDKSMKFAESIGYRPKEVEETSAAVVKLDTKDEVPQAKGVDDTNAGNTERVHGVSERKISEGTQGNAEERDIEPVRRGAGIESRSVLSGHGSTAEGEQSQTGNRRHDGADSVGERDRSNGKGTDKRNAVRTGLTPAQKKGAKATEIAGHNFTITDEDNIGKGGEKTKYKDNVEAIKLLKQLEAENRLATPEEQKVLAKYVGWGGLAPVFNIYGRDSKWASEIKELQELLTTEEYNAARASTTNAHYTSPAVIKGVWDIVERLGFKGGRVLEPSMGIGNFFGLMPESMRNKSALSGVELDSLTGRIAKQLYQKANIEITGYQNTKYPDGFFDLVISNVPFGDYKIPDPKYNKFNFNIHNYFFAKAVDQVREGGLVCFITSTGTMQSGSDSKRLRDLLSNKVDFIGAVRLPNTAFKENAGTEVTTDLIILQKRTKGTGAGKHNHAWLNNVDSEVLGKYSRRALPINEYYAENPDMLIGKLVEDKLWSDRLALDGTGLDIGDELAKRTENFPKNIYKPLTGKRNLDSVESAKETFLAPSDTKANAYVLKDSKAYRNIDGKLVELDAKIQEKAKGYIFLRDTVKKLLAAQIDPKTTDEKLGLLRGALNKVYDNFVKKYGYVNNDKNRKDLSLDPEYGIVSAVENYKADKKTKTETASKNAIFTKRTVNAVVEIKHADSPSDALALSLGNIGAVDLDYIGKLMNKKPTEVVKALDGLIYQNPATMSYETADEYLSGNVREKLEYAKESAKHNKAFQKNVEALEKVQPEDLIAEEISVSLGTPWIPASDIMSFAAHMLDSDSAVLNVVFTPAVGNWTVNWSKDSWKVYAARNSVNNNSKWGTKRREFKNILEDALNQKSPVIYDTASDGSKTVNHKETILVQQKIAEVQDEFKKWIWQDEDRRERLTNYYNNNFNNWRLREYDGSHLTLPGYSAVEPSLRKHQKDAVWRIMQNGNTLLAHCVGAGKTWTMQTAAMELKRLGIAKKSMFVIPNHMLQQFENEFRRIYPNAKLLTISSENLPDVNIPNAKKLKKGELETRRAEKNAARQRILSQIATEDWDGIIISHNMFKRIPMSEQAYAEFYREQIDEMREAIAEIAAANDKTSNRIVKELEKRSADLEAKLQNAMNVDNKDIVIPFEQLGIDQIFVDEADLFKNLFFTTKMSRISGLSNTNSQRSTDMFMKTQYITKMNGGRGVVFATGTPISNTMAEMFTMIRYLDMQGLKEKNMGFFDNWAANFAVHEPTVERSPSGNGYRQTEKFTSFTNMPELIKMFRKFADVKTQSDLNLNIPKLKNGKVTVIEIEPNSALSNYIKNTIADRAEAIRNRRVDPSEDNMLKLTGDLRKASLDMRLVNPDVPASVAQGKIKAVADSVFKKYEETTDVLGAQLIFCDLSTPKGASDKVTEGDDIAKEIAEDGENVTAYEEIKKMLVKKGVPSGEIAFIHDAKNKEQKERLFEKVRSGEVRVLIGSTEKMGAGTNIQEKLVALHHVDAPWRPRDIEQREGRILRQGNENKEVEIFNYVTKDSFDANMWEKLKNKATMINQAMSNNLSNRIIGDMDANVMTFAEVEALASGNPLMAERTMVSAEINKYETLRGNHARQQAENKRKANSLPAAIKQAELNEEQAQNDVKKRVDISGDKFRMTLGNKTYTKRTEAKEAIEAAVKEYKDETTTTVGSIGGFALRFCYVKAGRNFRKNGTIYTAQENMVLAEIAGENVYGCESSLGSIEYAVMNAPDKMADVAAKTKEALTKELKSVEAEISRPFEYEEKYQKLKTRLEEIERELNITALSEVPTEETAEEDKQYSIRDDADTFNRSIEEIAEEVKTAFPNAKSIEKQSDGTIRVVMPNGIAIKVDVLDRIIVNEKEEEKARQDHNASDSDIVVQGYWQKVSESDIDGMIAVSKDSAEGTTYHESLHMAMDLVLTPKEKKALTDYYAKKAKASGKAVEEAIADGYAAWRLARKNGKGTLLGKLFKKMHDFWHHLKAVFTGIENAHNVMRRIESGEVWEREARAEATATNKPLYSAKQTFTASKNRIKHFVKTALEHPDEQLALRLGKVSKAERDAILSATGIDVEGYEHVWLSDDIRHARNRHGKNKEKREDQIGLSAEDMVEALSAIESPDKIKKGSVINNEPRIKFYKTVSDGEYTVVEVVKKGKRLIVKTMWKKRKEATTTTPPADKIDRQLNALDDNGKFASVQNTTRRGSAFKQSVAQDDEGVKYSIHQTKKEKANSPTVEEAHVAATNNLVKKLFRSLKNKVVGKHNPLIKVVEGKDQQGGIGLIDYYIVSPSKIAEKVPTFKNFFQWASNAMEKEMKLRSEGIRKLSAAFKLASSKEDRAALVEVLWAGDLQGKEWTREELLNEGVSENVATAYIQIRRLMTKFYHYINDARTRKQTISKVMSKQKAKELERNDFVTRIISQTEEGQQDGYVLVTYEEYKHWEREHNGITADVLMSFENDDAIQVLSIEEIEVNGEKLYNVKVRERIGDMHKRTGYIPHFFHEFFVVARVKDENGKIVDKIVGSARSQAEAVKQAEEYAEWQKKQGNEVEGMIVRPKQFNFAALGVDEDQIAATVGDIEYGRIVRKLQKENDMTLAEAKDMLTGIVKQKNRHRFYGNMKERKGVEGYEKDMEWVLRHFVNSASRYAALETEFKPKAISYYERVYGPYDRDPQTFPNKKWEARYVKDYISDINGNPSQLEEAISKAVRNIPWLNKHLKDSFGERYALFLAGKVTGWMSVLKLGILNVSSALLNLSQLVNATALIGDANPIKAAGYLAKAMAKLSFGKTGLSDHKVLVKTGVLEDIGLDSGSGYDRVRKQAGSYILGMGLFKKTEELVRRSTVLAAYERAKKGGKTEAEAIEFAKEVNRKANFDYGVQDAPNIFRRGSVISQILLQFKKYGIKEIELMLEMTPFIGKTTNKKQKAAFWTMYILCCAGLWQTPLFGLIDDLVSFFSGLMGHTISPTNEFKAYVYKKIDENPESKPFWMAVMKGVPFAAGIDLSARTGMADFFPSFNGQTLLGVTGTTTVKTIGHILNSDFNPVLHPLLGFAGSTAITPGNFFSGEFEAGLRSISPSFGNFHSMITGEKHGKRGRMMSKYEEMQDRIIRAAGFTSSEEAEEAERAVVERYVKSVQAREKQEAIDDLLEAQENGEDWKPYAKRLMELGVTGKTVEAERKRKKMTAKEIAEEKEKNKKKRKEKKYSLSDYAEK